MVSLKILFLESFYGGSHKAFADGLIRHSRHSFHLETLPARFWKWRLRGSSFHFFREIGNIHDYDLILSGGMMNLADLKALAGPDIPPVVLYSHESQLSYPLPPEEKIDYQFRFTDISNCLTAEAILFNSRFHRDSFFQELDHFYNAYPSTALTGYGSQSAKNAGCSIPVVIFPLCRTTKSAGKMIRP